MSFESQTPKRVLKPFQLTMMGVAAIFAIRTLSITAIYGESAITYYMLAAILFLIPTALVCAELATTWPRAGGLYAWVKLALGDRWGFLAIWLEWVNTTVSFPAMITFTIFTLTYPLAQMVANNVFFEYGLFLLILWGLTFINFIGIKTSSRLTSFFVITGVFIPVILIILLGIFWLLSGHPSNLHFTMKGLIPGFHLATLGFLVAVINSFSGVQIIAFHAESTVKPEQSFKTAIFNIVVILLALAILGTLAMAVVLPSDTLNLIGGLIQSFYTFLAAFHLQYLVFLVAIAVGIGVLSEINSWLIGPAKGLLAAAEHNILPKLFKKTNKKNVPVGILSIQAFISSLLGLAYLLMQNVNSAYWLLSDLTAQFTLLMWLLVFTSAVVLHFKYKTIKRPFKIPGKTFGSIVVPLVGGTTAICIFMVGFIPPDIIIKHHETLFFESFIIIGLVLFSSIAFFIKQK